MGLSQRARHDLIEMHERPLSSFDFKEQTIIITLF